MKQTYAKLMGGCQVIRPMAVYQTAAALPSGEVVPVIVTARFGYCYGCSGARGYDKLSASGVQRALETGKQVNGKQGYVPVDQNSRGQWETRDSFYANNSFYGQTVEGWEHEA